MTPATATGLPAATLGWCVAADVGEGRVIPTHDLAITIQHAILDEFATSQEPERQNGGDTVYYGIVYPVGEGLGWLIRHHPDSAKYTLGAIVGEAERRLQIPREVSELSLRKSIGLDGHLDDETAKSSSTGS
jgi:hypothetical protein